MPHKAQTQPKAWLVPFLAICIAMIIAFAWPSDVTVAPRNPDSDPGNDRIHSTTISTAPRIAPAVAENLDRIAVPELVRVTAPASSDDPQGLRGTIIDSQSRRLPNVSVFLLESASNDPMLFPLLQQQPHLLAPLTSAKTALDGSFAVGLPVAQDRTYDLFILSPQHATVRLTGLRLLADTWHDLGDLILNEGATIRGKVTVMGQPNMPVPQAVVSISSGGAFADAALRALPAELGALIANVNANGEYELQHAPSRGQIAISAIAPGFAKVVKRDIEISDAMTAQVDIELPPGKELFGDVRTATGLAITTARIEAWPKQSNQPPLIAFSDQRGVFHLQGLRPGPHTVKATAPGFAKVEQAGVEPGDQMHLTMVPKNRIRVVVTTQGGRILRNYQLGLRRFFAKDHNAPLDDAALASGTIGSIHEVLDQRVRLNGATDYAEILDVPDGTFCCEIEAQGFAKTLSLPVDFRNKNLTESGQAEQTPGSTQSIEVVVTKGCDLRGRVIDANGAPLAQATIKTQSPGTMPDSPVIRMMQGWVPKRITERTARTDDNGFFRLENIALATYQLQVEHPDACRVILRNINCQQLGVVNLPLIEMTQGTVVTGIATNNGTVKGQMKVVLTTLASSPADMSIRMETVTDGEGRYRFNRRIPPGSYELRTAMVGSNSPRSEIFEQLLQFKSSTITLDIVAGQNVTHQDLNLPAAN